MDLKKKAIDIRKDVVKMIHHAGTGHIGGDLSVTDILVALYYEAMNVAPDKLDDPERDRFVMSKGHSVEALYAVLADRGFFPKEELESYSAYGSRFIGHPNNKIPGTAFPLASVWRSPRAWMIAVTASMSSWATANVMRDLSGRQRWRQATTNSTA